MKLGTSVQGGENMANTKAAVKRARQSREQNLRNRMVKSHLKRAVKGFYQSVDGNDAEAAREAYLAASRVIDKAASKGVIHKNTAARKKSRLAQVLKSQAS